MSRIETLLNFLYDKGPAQTLGAQIKVLVAGYATVQGSASARPAFLTDERTALLITYGDQVRAENHAADADSPLHVLADFLGTYISGMLTGIHILPFYPSSSDDGFSVMDYYAVDSHLGTWEDIARLGERFDLMFDAVINHASAQGEWFQRFLDDAFPEREYFLVTPEDFDTAKVIRPRTLPLITPVDTVAGAKRMWTTFSADQIDLDYHHSELVLRILDVLLFYVTHGARLLRLDAIAFLWKESGTTCLHLPQTHAMIQLVRAVLDEVAPQVILVTETNVPHADNLSYLSDGTNEAQWVYNFALPPLTLHTLQTGDATKLAQWAQTLQTPSDTTTFFNFLASHDGIGLNPARGILSDDEVDALVTRTLERGGLISYKNNPDGSASPYEMNINYLDALTVPGEGEAISLARFVCAQSILLALAGVPGIYFHSLFGSRGDRVGAEESGMPRRINRQKFTREELERELANPQSRRTQVLAHLRALLAARAEHAAFHPHAPQRVLADDPRVFALLRGEGGVRVLCLHNVMETAMQFDLKKVGVSKWLNVMNGETIAAGASIVLQGYAVAWLEAR